MPATSYAAGTDADYRECLADAADIARARLPHLYPQAQPLPAAPEPREVPASAFTRTGATVVAEATDCGFRRGFPAAFYVRARNGARITYTRRERITAPDGEFAGYVYRAPAPAPAAHVLND